MKDPKKKQYTFNDWLNGEISNNKVKELYMIGALNQIRGQKPPINENEYQKIVEAQRQTFDKAMEINRHYKKKYYESQFSEPDSSKRLIELEIKKLQKFIDDNVELEIKYEKGQREIAGILPEEYVRISEMYSRFKSEKPYAMITKISSADNTPSQLFEMYIAKHSLEYLQSLVKKSGKTISGIEPVSDTLKDRILNRMQELTDARYSDNEAAKMVSAEFDGIRSDSTIKKWFRNYH